jgi:hypothetical protein
MSVTFRVCHHLGEGVDDWMEMSSEDAEVVFEALGCPPQRHAWAATASEKCRYARGRIAAIH